MTWGPGTKAPSFSSHWVWYCRKHFHVLWPGEVWGRSSPSEFQAPLFEVSSNRPGHYVTLGMCIKSPAYYKRIGQDMWEGVWSLHALSGHTSPPAPPYVYQPRSSSCVYTYIHYFSFKIFEYYIICNLKIKNLSCWGESWSLTAERGLSVVSNLISSRLSSTVWLSAWDSRENGHLWLTGH